MKINSKLVRIGNSRGIRIPQLALELSGINENVEIIVQPGEISITNAPIRQDDGNITAFLSENVLGQDWNRPEEDEAWQDL